MRSGILALLAAMLLVAAPAAAHKMRVFAVVNGPVIEGYAYFSPGGRAQETPVTLSDRDGRILARSATDSDGRFRFTAPPPGDYRIAAGGADGHAASFDIQAQEFTPAAEALPPPALADPPAAAETPPQPELVRLLDASLSRQIAPLRAELDAFANRIFWHDVLGGLGYILGLGGLYYGVTARRRQDGG